MERPAMTFGIFDHVEQHDGDLASHYADRVRVAQAADRAGFFCYHVAEHQGTPLSLTPSPNILLAQLAMATTRLRLGALCYILPLYDPLRLANEICMLDQMSDGRLEVGIGRGISPIEMGFFNLDAAASRARFEENLAVLLEVLTGSTLDFDGEWHQYHEVPVVLTPRQRPHPSLWYPTSGMESIPWLAARRYHTVFQGSSSHVAEQVRRYRDSYPDADELEDAKYGKLLYVFVADTDAEAMRVAVPTYRRHLDHLTLLARQRKAPTGLPRPETIPDAVREGWAAVGAPETVAAQLVAIREATGCNYVVFNPLLADTPGDRGVANVELFGDQVLPRLS